MASSTPPSSAPSSLKPKSKPSPSKKPLNISNVANIFIRMRRHQDFSTARLIESSSGDAQTWPSLAGATEDEKIPFAEHDVFICSGAVDVVKLLRSSRAGLYKKALAAGGSNLQGDKRVVLVDEQWECVILSPKYQQRSTYKVHINYSASATLSKYPDPQRPVALERVKCVPGLMTVLERL